MENNTGQQQVYSMSTLNKVSQLGKLGMMSVLLGALTLPAQAMTTLTVDAVLVSAFTLDNTPQYGYEHVGTETDQGELGEITITFDETLIPSNGNYDFSAADPVSSFDISLKIFGQTFSRETDIDTNYVETKGGDNMGTPYFWLTNYHTPEDRELHLMWVISEVDLPQSLIPVNDQSSGGTSGGTVGDNYTEIVTPNILSLAIYRFHRFEVNTESQMAATGNPYNVGIELVVVPVPATAWLFATALAGLAGVSSRRRLKQ